MATETSFARIIKKWQAEKGPLRIASASGQLGYGIPEKPFRAALERDLHLIGADMGSVDPGPYYLGSGKLATARRSTKRDLKLVLTGALQMKVPLVIGTAGTAGGNTHLDQTLDIVREIAREEGLKFRLAIIRSEMPRDLMKRQARAGKITPIGPIPDLTEEEIDGAACIVGQAGTEAFVRAIDTLPDVIIAGRACDTGIYTCLPQKLGFPIGPALQMAKIIECASLCCEGGGRDTMLGTLEGESFILESMNPIRKATPMSVAAHGLYEQADPLSVAEPEGVLYLQDSKFEAVDERRCRVSGGRWEPTTRFSVKIEGATRVGARAIMVAGSADPVFIEKADEIAASVEATIRELVPPNPKKPYTLYFRFYGRGVVGGQPVSKLPEEVGVIVECIGEDEEEARAVAATAKQYLLHAPFPGRISTAGNLGFPFTPPELTAGDAYRFSVYHIMQVDDLAPLFPVATEQVG
ncbi:MAG: acyclic terpene utilization AtuA family protein [Proteobacteria bacterium]|nr:acyclic terpene utilization AtuA family protein [Pseudomonadota bacterium]